MQQNSIEKDLKNIFEGVGVYINSTDYDKKIEIDSLQFVTVIVDIEEHFLLRISADYEEFSELKSFNDFRKMIESHLMSLSSNNVN